MKKIEELLENCLHDDENVLLADGFEDAIMGIGRQFVGEPIAVYDRTKCIEILVERDGMDWEEAQEYFSFNVEGAYVGKQTPMFVER